MHFARDLMTTSTLDNLQVWLSAEARSLCATLEVHGYERDPDRLVVDLADPRGLGSAVRRRGLARGALFHQLVGERPPPEGQRRFGNVLVRGRGRGTAGRYLGIQFDSNTPLRRSGDQWLWSNSIDASVTAGRVEGLDRADWVGRLGLFLAQDPDLVWGAAYMQDEFRASNLDASSGLRAIGRDARRHLPGLYWLNYFGEPFTSLMALDSARATGIGTWTELDHAVVFECYGNPEEWPTVQRKKEQIIDALGSDLFFDRRDALRQTRAPDFGVTETPTLEPKTFEVFTSDGSNFTHMPLD
jgi:hypothetical protein